MADPKYHKHLKNPPKPPGKPGRAPELTEEKMDAVVNALRLGIYPDTAYKLAGLSGFAIKQYIVKSLEHPESIYATFVEKIKKAIAEAEVRDIATIDGAAHGKKGIPLRNADGSLVFDNNGKPVWEQYPVKGDWKAAAWKLERRFKSKWGQALNMADPDPMGDHEAEVEREAVPSPKMEDIKELAQKVLLDDPDAE